MVTQLALKAGRGDRQALTQFIAATQQDVWRLLAHLAGPEHADDLTQETYLRILGALKNFRAQSSAKTWLLAIARRVWVDSVRHDLARPRKSHVEVEDTLAGRPVQGLEDMMDVRLLLQSLPEERREALILTQVLGYSYEEAANICGVRVGTIRSRVARARAQITAANLGQPSPDEKQAGS